MAQAWTDGIRTAAADYIHFLSADDYLRRDAIELMLGKMQGHDWCYCGLALVDGRGQHLENWSYADWPLDSDAALARARRTLSMPVPIVGLHRVSFLRKNHLQGVRFPSTGYAEDLATALEWVRCRPRICRLDAPVYHYRRHSSTTSGAIHAAAKRVLVKREALKWFSQIDLQGVDD